MIKLFRKKILFEPKSYDSLMEDLTIPSHRQTINFIDFVSYDHSWYKHIGLRNEKLFVFYLDPNAGRSLLLPKKGKQLFEFLPLEEDKDARNHISRFGYWNYYTEDYTVDFIPNTNGTMKDSRPYFGLNITDPKGKLVPIPEAAVSAGTIKLSGFLHGGFKERPEHLSLIASLEVHLKKLKIYYCTNLYVRAIEEKSEN